MISNPSGAIPPERLNLPAGAYLCTYDDGSAVDVYAVTIATNEASPVPVLPSGELLIVLALRGPAFTWRYRRFLRA